MTSGAISIVQRGGRIRKRGKHVVTFNAAMGVALQGAAALALGGALALALPQAALADACGAMPAGGGAVVCNVETYTPLIDGDGTAGNVGTTQVLYGASLPPPSLTNATSITLNELFLRTGQNAVILDLAGSAEETSSIVVNGGAFETTDLTGSVRTIVLTDRRAGSAGTSVTLNGSASVIMAAGHQEAVYIDQFNLSNAATGDMEFTMNDTSSITSGGVGAFLWHRMLGSYDARATLNDTASITSEGRGLVTSRRMV